MEDTNKELSYEELPDIDEYLKDPNHNNSPDSFDSFSFSNKISDEPNLDHSLEDDKYKRNYIHTDQDSDERSSYELKDVLGGGSCNAQKNVLSKKSPYYNKHDAELSSAGHEETTGEETIADGSQNLLYGKFMPDFKLIDILLSDDLNPLKHIPDGRKEDCYFVVDNTINRERRTANIRSCFDDDCGAWRKSPSPISRLVRCNGGWRYVVKRDGKLC